MRLLAAVVLSPVLVLVGCSSAPPTDQVEKDVAAQLDEAFGQDLFTDIDFSARGSSNDIFSPAEQARRVVYYDADLILARDMDFGGWNTPGVASLVTIFGAGPKGVRGAKTGGNKAGDEISVHGSAIYKREGSEWSIVVPAGFEPPVAPSLDSLSAPSASERLLTALGDAIHAVPAGTTPEAQAVIDEELARAVAAIQARVSRLSQGYAIASGPDGGQYLRLAQALQTDRAGAVKFQALLTQGSVENIDLMRRATVPLAIVQADIAAQALAGEGVFAAMAPFGNLRALGSLFPEALHIVVRADSPVVSLKDLTGKRIALGPPGSGSRVTAEQVLEAQGLRRGQDYILDESPFTASLGALASGSVDAVIQMIGLPADQARAAAAAGRFKLVSLDEDIIQPLTGPGSALFPGVIPKGTYPGVDVDIRTLSVAALMTTTTALSESEVTMLMRAVFGQGNDLLGAGSSQGGQIGVSNARTGLTIPLAPGAEAALAELGAGQ